MALILLCLCAAAFALWRIVIPSQKWYSAQTLGIDELCSSHDENGNGIDDYHDLVAGARAYVESGPSYQSITMQGATRMMSTVYAQTSSGMRLRRQAMH